MPQSIKLYYFDFHGGRGETARIALTLAGVPFEDVRVKRADWPALKATLPFGQMPVLEVDGQRLAQCNAINRYVGQLTGLLPADPWLAAQCDEACCVVEALNDAFSPSFGMKGDEQKRERERLLSGPVPTQLKGLDRTLTERGGEWFVDGRLTIADLKVFELTSMFASGRLDHVPADLLDTVAPALAAHHGRMQAHPGVRAYYARFGL